MLWTFLSSDMIDMVAPGGGGALWTMMCSMSVIAILSAIDQNWHHFGEHQPPENRRRSQVTEEEHGKVDPSWGDLENVYEVDEITVVGSRKIMMNECKRRAEAEWEKVKWVLGDLFQSPLGDMQIWLGQRWWDRNFSDFSGPLVDSDETINYFTRVIVIYGDHLWILSTQMSKQDDHFYYKSFPGPPANAIRRLYWSIDGSICILFNKNPTVQKGFVEFIIWFL